MKSEKHNKLLLRNECLIQIEEWSHGDKLNVESVVVSQKSGDNHDRTLYDMVCEETC
jgi:hypothetical protein